MQNIANKVVIITGASSGIGEATALKLAREGAKIVLGARREDKLKAIADQIKAAGGEAVYRVTDVVKPEDNAALVALAKETFGKVDVIFLNAGLMPSSPLAALETAPKPRETSSPPQRPWRPRMASIRARESGMLLPRASDATCCSIVMSSKS